MSEVLSLKQELESLKMSVNMLMTLSQSQQMLINNLNNKVFELKPTSPKTKVEEPKKVEELKKVEEPKKLNKVIVVDYNELALEWVKENTNDKALNLTIFIQECKSAMLNLPLQNTDNNLEDVITNAVKYVYNNLPVKNKPFFSFGPYLNRNIIYKNKSNDWKVGTDEVVKLVSWLEKNLRECQLAQINNDIDYMTPEDQELYTTYMKWTTSEIDKSKIAKNLLEFITVIKIN